MTMTYRITAVDKTWVKAVFRLFVETKSPITWTEPEDLCFSGNIVAMQPKQHSVFS